MLIVAPPSPIVVDPRGPVKTLDEAVVRAKATGNRRIVLVAGVHRAWRAVVIDPALAGLRITGRKGAVLSGAEPIVFRPANRSEAAAFGPGGPVWRAPLTVGPARLTRRGFGVKETPGPTEILREGKPLRLAADEDWFRYGAAADGTVDLGDPARVALARTPGVLMYAYWAFDWADSYEPVTVRPDGKIGVEGPLPLGMKAGRRYRLVNVPSLMDRPGEYWIDQENAVAYLRLAPGDAPKTMEATVNDAALLAVNAPNVTVEGFELRGGRAVGISVIGEGATLRNLGVRSFGRSGIVAIADRLTVDGCDVEDVGEAGVDVLSGDRKKLLPGRSVVRDLRARRVGRWIRTYRPGVSLSGIGNRLERSAFSEMPHQAIAIFGNDQVVERCDISDVCRETGDSGAIYMGRDPSMRGTIIRANRFTNIAPRQNTEGAFNSVMGVYLDDCWPDTLVEGNLFDMRGHGVMVGGGQDNVVRGNVFVRNRPAISVDDRGRGWAKDQLVRGGAMYYFGRTDELNLGAPPWSTRYPDLATLEKRDYQSPRGNVIEDNDFLDSPLDVEQTRPGELVLRNNRDVKVLPAKAGRIAKGAGLVRKTGRPLP